MRVDAFDYDLPEELIAARPPSERDGGRLMVLGGSGAPEDRAIVDLPALIPEGALLVLNDTRVMPARMFGRKPTGGKVELLLVEKVSTAEGGRETWRAMVRSSKGADNVRIEIDGAPGLTCEIAGRSEEDSSLAVVTLTPAAGTSVAQHVEAAGHMPLPPYMKRPDDEADRERYQTVFARSLGAVAAPTAGLHLSERLLAALAARGVSVAYVTLHVSLGTFQPVKVDDLDDHPMHAEFYDVSEATAAAIAAARARGAPVVSIGTTVLRALETTADPSRPGFVKPGAGRTRLLIQPGYALQIVDVLLTNFHLPRSTLLALVCAFGGTERVLAAYREAVARRYRFFSYGDAMLIQRAMFIQRAMLAQREGS